MTSLRFWNCCSLILGMMGNARFSLLAKSENPEEREKLNDERDSDEKGERKPRERDGRGGRPTANVLDQPNLRKHNRRHEDEETV